MDFLSSNPATVPMNVPWPGKCLRIWVPLSNLGRASSVALAFLFFIMRSCLSLLGEVVPSVSGIDAIDDEWEGSIEAWGTAVTLFSFSAGSALGPSKLDWTSAFKALWSF